MTLNGVMGLILRYFAEFARKKFTFAISSPDEFLVLLVSSDQSSSCIIAYTFSQIDSTRGRTNRFSNIFPPVTLTIEPNLHTVDMNQHATYLGQG